MSILNNPGCVVTAANTGLPDCPFTPDKFVGAILIDKSYVFADADVLTATAFLTKLQELVLTTGKNRAYPIFRFEEITDNSEEETVVTLGYGGKQVVKDGKYDWTFRLTKGGLCFQKKLRAFNKVDKKVLFIDDSGNIYGTVNSSGFTGFSMDFFFAKPFKASDGSNAAMFNARFALSKPKEFNDDVAFIKTDLDVEESVKGILDVELTEEASIVGYSTISVKTACDKVSIYDLFADDLADPDMWVVKTSAGVEVTVSAVTKVAVSEAWKLAFTGTGAHTIQLAEPSVLATAGIGGGTGNGFESDVITVTMPSE